VLAVVAVVSSAAGVVIGLRVWPAATATTAQPGQARPESEVAVPSKSAGAEQSELRQVAALVDVSAKARNGVVDAVQAVGACTMKPGRGVAALKKAISERRSATGQLEALSVADVPGGQQMLADLESSLRQSSRADEGFIGWMRDMAGSGTCPIDTATDTSYQAGYRASKAANTAKAQFLQLWNPLAREFGQPVFTTSEI
jgi:hypothetical protein